MIHYEILREAGNSAKLENGEIISCESLDHCLMFTAKKEGWLPAEYKFPSGLVDGADVYMWNSIKRDFKRPLLVHELAEFLFKYERFGDSLSYPDFIPEKVYNEESRNAHQFARECDDRFARETLGEQIYMAYCKFRDTVI